MKIKLMLRISLISILALQIFANNSIASSYQEQIKGDMAKKGIEVLNIDEKQMVGFSNSYYIIDAKKNGQHITIKYFNGKYYIKGEKGQLFPLGVIENISDRIPNVVTDKTYISPDDQNRNNEIATNPNNPYLPGYEKEKSSFIPQTVMPKGPSTSLWGNQVNFDCLPSDKINTAHLTGDLQKSLAILHRLDPESYKYDVPTFNATQAGCYMPDGSINSGSIDNNDIFHRMGTKMGGGPFEMQVNNQWVDHEGKLQQGFNPVAPCAAGVLAVGTGAGAVAAATYAWPVIVNAGRAGVIYYMSNAPQINNYVIGLLMDPTAYDGAASAVENFEHGNTVDGVLDGIGAVYMPFGAAVETGRAIESSLDDWDSVTPTETVPTEREPLDTISGSVS